MRSFIFATSIVFLLQFFVNSCANPLAPTGGPKDTIPPELIRSDPTDQSLNFQKQIISLTFNEFISADKLKQSLIITPVVESTYKTFIKKELISLEFDEPFNDSTTYTFNFFDGITDITENNPAENLVLAFSTGNYIDSLEIFGNVKDLFTGKPIPKATIGLYSHTDTLDFQLVKPTYFTTSDESGAFHIQNIKANRYRIFSFLDENKNLLFDPASESYSFLPETFLLDSTISDSIQFKLIKIDASELKMSSARATGRYFEVRYTKPINHFSYQTTNSQYLPSILTGENNTIRFYDDGIIKHDSLQVILQVRDSLRNSLTDTVFVKFRESSRKADDFKANLLPKSNSSIFKDPRFELSFNKPTIINDSNFLTVPLDTFYHLSYPIKDLKFNDTRTRLFFNIDITRSSLSDSIKSFLTANPIDSTSVDSTQLFINEKLSSLNNDRFKLNVSTGSFISVENDTSQSISQSYKFADPKSYGTITVNISTTVPSYTVQLMKKDAAIKAISNCTSCKFTNTEPGDYWVRILIDNNEDGKWSVGNYLENEPAESILHFKETTTLRANWEVTLDYSF